LLDVSDSKEKYKLQIVYSVLAVDAIPKDAKDSFDVKVSATTEQWTLAMVGKKYEDLKIEGSLDKLKQFISYFEL